MCGIVGMVGDITHEMRTKIFRDLLDVCQLRGRDSTGVIKVTKEQEYTWAKQVGVPSILCDSRMYENTIEKGDAIALIGHCRAKTIGEVNAKSAHPFDYPDEGICGVHNGTLRNHHSLDGYNYQKVDSEVLYGHLAKNGVDETFSKVDGAFTCVWWDDTDKTVNFIRNDERPLWFTWSADYRVMFFASEPWMFGAIQRKIKLWEGDDADGKNKFYELPVMQHWSFKINPKAGVKDKVLTMNQPRKVLKKVTPPFSHNRGSYGGSVYRNGSVWVEDSEGNYSRVLEKAPESKANVSENNNAVSNANNGNKTGGEVTNPFAKSGDSTPEDLQKALQKLQEKSPEATSSPLSNVTFLTNSARKSGSSTETTSTKCSSRKILSLPDRNSTSNQQTSKGGASPSSAGFCTTSSRNSSTGNKEGVSFRTVAGIDYITDNRTGREWNVDELLVNTGGSCSFCKEEVDDLKKIAHFLDAKRFVCTSCVTPPYLQIASCC